MCCKTFCKIRNGRKMRIEQWKNILPKKTFTCSDLSDDECENYSYSEAKSCLINDNQCKEVELDDRCSIINGECSGTSCKFDGRRCYYENQSPQDNSEYYLKFRQIIILALLLF